MPTLSTDRHSTPETGTQIPPPGRGRAIGVLGVLVVIMAIPILASAGSGGFSFFNNSDPDPVEEPAGEQPTIVAASPETLNLHAVEGRAAPPPLDVALDVEGEGLEEVSAATDAGWLDITTDLDTISVALIIDGLSPGIYSTTIEFAPGEVEIPVSLQIHEPVERTQFSVSPEKLAAEIESGSDPPPDLEFDITSEDEKDAEWTAVTSAKWLRLSSYSGTAPSTVAVTIDADLLAEGSHTGKVWLGGSSLEVEVNVVAPEGSQSDDSDDESEGDIPEAPGDDEPENPAALAVNKDAISFAAIQGGLTPPGKSVTITSEEDEEVSWSAEAGESWLVMSESSGTTPQTIWVGADVDAMEPGEYETEITIGDVAVPVEVIVLDEAASDPAFDTVRDRLDLPVENGAVSRTWQWGPESLGTVWERFDDAPNGERLVQYYDKGRLEITYPDADGESDWYVTTGLLVLEMIGGEIQVGEDEYLETEPADIPVAGDADDELGPRYRTFAEHLDATPLEAGSTVTQTIDADGDVQDDPAMADYGVRVTGPHAVTGHTVASVFWDYLNSTGAVYEDEFTSQGLLFDPWFYATGLPITEPYWANVTANGEVVDVLIQCFERRCLTYTPSYEAAWQVEQGNVGLHYFRWRYENPDLDAADLIGRSAFSE